MQTNQFITNLAFSVTCALIFLQCHGGGGSGTPTVPPATNQVLIHEESIPDTHAYQDSTCGAGCPSQVATPFTTDIEAELDTYSTLRIVISGQLDRSAGQASVRLQIADRLVIVPLVQGGTETLFDYELHYEIYRLEGLIRVLNRRDNQFESFSYETFDNALNLNLHGELFAEVFANDSSIRLTHSKVQVFGVIPTGTRLFHTGEMSATDLTIAEFQTDIESQVRQYDRIQLRLEGRISFFDNCGGGPTAAIEVSVADDTVMRTLTPAGGDFFQLLLDLDRTTGIMDVKYYEDEILINSSLEAIAPNTDLNIHGRLIPMAQAPCGSTFSNTVVHIDGL